MLLFKHMAGKSPLGYLILLASFVGILHALGLNNIPELVQNVNPEAVLPDGVIPDDPEAVLRVYTADIRRMGSAEIWNSEEEQMPDLEQLTLELQRVKEHLEEIKTNHHEIVVEDPIPPLETPPPAVVYDEPIIIVEPVTPSGLSNGDEDSQEKYQENPSGKFKDPEVGLVYPLPDDTLSEPNDGIQDDVALSLPLYPPVPSPPVESVKNSPEDPWGALETKPETEVIPVNIVNTNQVAPESPPLIISKDGDDVTVVHPAPRTPSGKNVVVLHPNSGCKQLSPCATVCNNDNPEPTINEPSKTSTSIPIGNCAGSVTVVIGEGKETQKPQPDTNVEIVQPSKKSPGAGRLDTLIAAAIQKMGNTQVSIPISIHLDLGNSTGCSGPHPACKEKVKVVPQPIRPHKPEAMRSWAGLESDHPPHAPHAPVVKKPGSRLNKLNRNWHY